MSDTSSDNPNIDQSSNIQMQKQPTPAPGATSQGQQAEFVEGTLPIYRLKQAPGGGYEAPPEDYDPAAIPPPPTDIANMDDPTSGVTPEPPVEPGA